jgi:hypothetical protein
MKNLRSVQSTEAGNEGLMTFHHLGFVDRMFCVVPV